MTNIPKKNEPASVLSADTPNHRTWHHAPAYKYNDTVQLRRPFEVLPAPKG